MKNNGFTVFKQLIFSFLLILSACGGSQKVVVPETTKVLDTETLQALQSVSEDHIYLTFSKITPQLEQIQAGDVVVLGLTSHTPYGLLRKVVNAEENADGTFTLETTSAALTEVFQDAVIELPETEVTPDLIMAESLTNGVSLIRRPAQATMNLIDLRINKFIAPYVRVAGGMKIDLTLGMKIVISWFRLKEASAWAKLDEVEELGLVIGARLRANPKVDLAELTFTPFTIMVGPVPVYITTKLAYSTGANVKADAGINSVICRNK